MTVSRLRAIPIIFSLLLLTLSIGCRHRDELTERRLVGLRDSTRTFFMLKNYDTGMIYARRLETLSDPDLYPSYYVASLVYQGQGYVYLTPPQPDSMKFYFDKVYDLAVEQEDYWHWVQFITRLVLKSYIAMSEPTTQFTNFLRD